MVIVAGRGRTVETPSGCCLLRESNGKPEAAALQGLFGLETLRSPLAVVRRCRRAVAQRRSGPHARGTPLIEVALPRQLGGAGKLVFAPAGVRFGLTFPLDGATPAVE